MTDRRMKPTPVLDEETSRKAWLNSLMSVGSRIERVATIRQMLVEAMDYVERDGPEDRRLRAALAAFDAVGPRTP